LGELTGIHSKSRAPVRVFTQQPPVGSVSP
jgi:hypothetical protein